MNHAHQIAAFLFLAITVFLVGSHRLEISLVSDNLVTPVSRVEYDWKALDQRLKTINLPVARPSILPQPTSVPVVLIADSRSTSVPSRAEMESYVEEKFGKHAGIAKRVVMAESSWNSQAINHNRNGSWDFCLFQVNSIHGYSREHLSDFRNCVDAAYKLFQESGWKPWNASKHRWSKS